MGHLITQSEVQDFFYALIPLMIAVKGYFDRKNANETKAKIDDVQATANNTHQLVNGQLTASLTSGAVSARALAEAIPTPQNQALAETSEALLKEHMKGVPHDFQKP